MKRNALYNIQSEVFVFIIEEIKKGTKKNVLIKKIRNKYRSKIKSPEVIKKLLSFSLKKINSISVYDRNRVNSVKEGNRNELLYEYSKRYVNNISHEMNYVYYTMEEMRKKDYLDKLLSSGVFYLCSHHFDCAADHKPYQGKIYVSSFWEDRVTDENTKNHIRAYIRNRGIKRIEWVIGKPIYMVSRRNCRHFFERVPVEEVLSSSAKALLKKRGIYSIKEGNGEEYWLRYYRRYQTLIDLYNVLPCDKLLKDIKRTKLLIKKWKQKEK